MKWILPEYIEDILPAEAMRIESLRRKILDLFFKKKYELPFTLLADPEHAIAEQYGVWGEKNYAGRKYMGISRTTFVIDADGNLVKAMHNVKPDGHPQKVLEALPS